MRTQHATRLVSGLLAAALAPSLQVQVAASAAPEPATNPTQARLADRVTFLDAAGDVRKPKLDIHEVKVINRSDKLRIRVTFPGVDKQYAFPTGAVMVYIDADEQRQGPEYAHFMDFWSDYRFAPTVDWTEQRVRAWGHSPEGRCVSDAGVRSDRQSKLRWFEYVVVKRKGCFQAQDVRVAVSTINTGELRPYREYRRPAWDHLIARHSWTDWIPQSE